MSPEDYKKIVDELKNVREPFIDRGQETLALDLFEKRLLQMESECEANTISSNDPCAEPKSNIHYCDCRTHDPADDTLIIGTDGCRYCGGDGTWEEVPVRLIDGECDGQEHYAKKKAEHLIVMSGSDGWGERQKYEWVLDENGERKYFNDVTNPGNGIYWMRWSEWLG